MPQDYPTFTRFSLDPANEREVLEGAITRAYQSSGGVINAFNAGSPLVVLLEALTFAHMEFLFWLNALPEAMALTYIAEVLGAGRSEGTKGTVQIKVDLTNALNTPFILLAGTKIASNINSEITYELVSDLTIPPGSVAGFVTAQATLVGPSQSVNIGELTILPESYAYLQSVTNTSASTTASSFETLEEVSTRVQTLMSQTTPVSKLVWLIIIEIYYPGKVAEVRNYDGVLYLYIQDYSTDLVFEDYCNRVKGLLQTIVFNAYDKALLQITIEPQYDLTSEQCLEIYTYVSNFLISKYGQRIQPVDIYEYVSTTFLNGRDLINFDVWYYYKNLDPLFAQSIPLNIFDYTVGQVVVSIDNLDYYVVSTGFNVINGPFDEAVLGYLSYHPVYLTNGLGTYSSGDIVLFSGLYYLITTSGNFDPLTTTNWQVLPTPISWSNNLLLTTTDFLIAPGEIPGLSHGFLPEFSYTTADTINSNLTAITPAAKNVGDTVSNNTYWYQTGFDKVVYFNDTGSNYTIDTILTPTQIANQVELLLKPDQQYSHLTRTGKYRIGTLDNTKNYIYITDDGEYLPLATGLIIPAVYQPYTPTYGTLIKSNSGEVYEVIKGFVPSLTETIDSLLSADLIKKAYEKYGQYDVLLSAGTTPYYFDIEFIYFKQSSDLIVKDGLIV